MGQRAAQAKRLRRYARPAGGASTTPQRRRRRVRVSQRSARAATVDALAFVKFNVRCSAEKNTRCYPPPEPPLLWLLSSSHQEARPSVEGVTLASALPWWAQLKTHSAPSSLRARATSTTARRRSWSRARVSPRVARQAATYALASLAPCPTRQRHSRTHACTRAYALARRKTPSPRLQTSSRRCARPPRR